MPHAAFRVIADDRPLLDEQLVVTLLSQHFPGVDRDAIRRAAADVVLLETLLRDEAVVWEDAMGDEPVGTRVTSVPHAERRRRS